MLDLGFVRGNLELVEEKLRARGADPAALLGDFRALDQNRREAITTSERLKARRNELSQQVGALKKAGQDATAVMDETRALKEELDKLDQTAASLDDQLRQVLAGIPNLTRDEVPAGLSETDNLTVKTWGEKPVLAFEPKPHWEVGEALGILDFERAAKISGARFVVYMGAGARLERAIISFMLDLHTQKHGYLEVWPPSIVNRASMRGTGQLPKMEGDMYRLGEDEQGAGDLFLIPTAEVPVTNCLRDTTVEEKDLPVKYTAYTPCFRKEAGSYGKDTRGLSRVHQFDKVEMVKFVKPEGSAQELEALVRDAEDVLQALELPYRVVLLGSGDMSFAAAKCYDLEVWAPAAQKWFEVSSCSLFTDFQARRMNIRYRNSQTKKLEYVHTLNGSGLALARIVLCLLENFQDETGKVVFPKALQPYLA